MNRIDRHQLIAYSLLTKWKKRPKTEYIREKHSHEKKNMIWNQSCRFEFEVGKPKRDCVNALSWRRHDFG